MGLALKEVVDSSLLRHCRISPELLSLFRDFLELLKACSSDPELELEGMNLARRKKLLYWLSASPVYFVLVLLDY